MLAFAISILFTLGIFGRKLEANEGAKSLDDIFNEISSLENQVQRLNRTMEILLDKERRQELLTDPCLTTQYLNESWRHIDYMNRGGIISMCDKTGGSSDTYTQMTGGWYRFGSAAGSQLPTFRSPGESLLTSGQICGTNGVAYIIHGGHPTPRDGIVTREVCFERTDSPNIDCYGRHGETQRIRVAACQDGNGEYYVYELQPVQRCNNAYCAVDHKSEICPPDTPFHCRSGGMRGQCIAEEFLCDGDPDCFDGSDENICQLYGMGCNPTRAFQCKSGHCIRQESRCDGNQFGYVGCQDGSDEEGCQDYACPEDRPFHCKSGECLIQEERCNGFLSCFDESDEHNCQDFACPEDRPFHCKSGECLIQEERCNGLLSCFDESDEHNCQDFGKTPPSFKKQPPLDELIFQVKSRFDETEKPVVIECEASGVPAPIYTWEKNGTPFNWQVYNDRISQLPGSGTLVITSPKTEDIGSYKCFATNDWGTATSNSVFVRQYFLRNFRGQPPITETAEEGKPFNLSCVAPDGYPKPSVYWMIQSFNGAQKTLNSSRLTVDPENRLWFSNVTMKDASDGFLYACNAASFLRNEYKIGNRVLLNVIGSDYTTGQQPPTKQYVTRKNQVAYRGKEVSLWCIYGGTPLPQITWSKKGGALPQRRTTFENDGKTLIIKHVDFDDEGEYTCEASNGVGMAESYSINLTVESSPYFIQPPKSVTAEEGETVMFECEAGGKPAPILTWIHNGKPIEDSPIIDNLRYTFNTNSIVIRQLRKSDTGNFGCKATSGEAYVYKDVFVNVIS